MWLPFNLGNKKSSFLENKRAKQKKRLKWQRQHNSKEGRRILVTIRSTHADVEHCTQPPIQRKKLKCGTNTFNFIPPSICLIDSPF